MPEQSYMECCSGHSLIIIIISLALLKTECKKVAVCLKEGSTARDAKSVAKENQYKIVKQVGNSCYLFQKRSLPIRRRREEGLDKTRDHDVEQRILSNIHVREAEVSIPKIRVKKNKILLKRSNFPKLDALARTFDDPMFARQWHLYNTEFSGKDLNVLPVWANNITGRGIVVAILDDGVEYTHPDIRDNYDASVSWDFLDNDDDPMPSTSPSDNNVDHGTRCAGQVAASKNNVCGVGVAFNAKVAGIRMLKNKVEDAMEAEALKHCRDKIHIYSSSWGPIDDGKKMDGPGVLVRNAFEEGVKYGRDGKGSIYVWASGNGGVNKDNCNCDGYCSSIYTISISAVNDKGQVPAYVEECSATLAAAYSSGTGTERRIATTDLNSGCTDEHGGTSAAAPLAAGVIALALSANPNLSWRDVQHLIVHSSSHPMENESVINGAGRGVNNKTGFGILDAAAMVDLATTWEPVAKQQVCRIIRPSKHLAQRDAMIRKGHELMVQIDTNACAGQHSEVAMLEHVQAVLSVEHENRGSLKIFLVSPSGTTSALLTERPSDKNNQGFARWKFLSVQMWGERAPGRWKLTIDGAGNGELTYFELILYGTKLTTNSTIPPCTLYSLISNDGSGSITCVATCPQFGYYATSTQRCLSCHPSCVTCTDYNVCTSCSDNLYLLAEENTCVRLCPEEYTVTNNNLYGKVCQASALVKPWYKGDTIYIIVVVIFVTLLIMVVLLIGMHHYRKCKDRSANLRFRDGTLYPHTPLKPIPRVIHLPDNSRVMHHPDNSRVSRDSPHVTSAAPSRGHHATSSRAQHVGLSGSYGNQACEITCVPRDHDKFERDT